MANTHSLDLELNSSQYAYVADNADVSITGDFTIEAWIKLEQLPSAAGTDFSIVSKYDWGADQREYRFYIEDSDDKMNLIFSDSGVYTDHASHFTCDTAFGAGDVDVWRHVVVSVDVSAPGVTFYIDGATKADSTTVSDATSVHDGTSPFMIGASKSVATPEQYFDGLVDEVRLWDDIRTLAEIKDNRFRQLSGGEGNLVGYWKLNNGYTDSAKSSTLTASGSPVFSVDVPFPGAGGGFLLNFV